MKNSVNDKIEKCLIDGAITTLVKQNIDLNMENIAILISRGLNGIIINGKYNDFTSLNDSRKKIQNYSRMDYINFILNKVAFNFGGIDEVISSLNIRKRDNGYEFDQYKMSEYIAFYIDNIFKAKGNFFGNESETLSEDYNINDSECEFYKPSNECREAIMSGKQTTFSFSSEKIAGMQAYSDVGKVRKNQEDSYYIGIHPKDNNLKIMMVADGMGGHSNGEIASNLVVRELVLWFESLNKEIFKDMDNKKIIVSLSNKLKEINSKVVKSTSGGGTTLCLSIINGEEIFICNIGDSRALVLEDGKLLFNTTSHSMPVVLGVPEPFDRFYRNNNVIIRNIGYGCQVDDLDADSLDIDIINMKSGRQYNVVMCSDGVSDCLSDDKMVEVVNNSSKDDIAANLVKEALHNTAIFKEEYLRYQDKYLQGIISEKDWKSINLSLIKNGLNVSTAITNKGGKDNTTVASGSFYKKR